MESVDRSSVEPKKIQVWTMQIARWRLAKQLEIPMLDITAKSGVQVFAPEFRKVMEYKWGHMSQEEYTRHYVEKMSHSQRDAAARWKTLTEKPKVALACYCPAGVFCHRHIFADLMEKYLKEQGFEMVRQGEILP